MNKEKNRKPILNGYHLFWGIFIDANDKVVLNKCELGRSIEGVKQKIQKSKGVKSGRFYMITDKQFGLIQYARNKTILTPNTPLSIHFLTSSKTGFYWLIPMTKKQFENPYKYQ